MTGSEERFAEVAGDNFFLVTDCSEIDAGVPTLEYIDVRRYMIEVIGCQWSAVRRTEEWFEKLGDARGLHM